MSEPKLQFECETIHAKTRKLQGEWTAIITHGSGFIHYNTKEYIKNYFAEYRESIKKNKPADDKIICRNQVRIEEI